MMKASVYIAISLDGFIARSDGDVGWLDAYHEDCGFAEFFSSVDCLVMGRKTFEKVLSFDVEWPYTGKHVVVLSHAGIEIPDQLSDGVECMAGSAPELASILERRGYKHLYVDGGATIRNFLEAGLIDSLTLTQVPILLGTGISLFTGLENEISLNHKSTQSFSNGLVQSHYEVLVKGMPAT